MWRLLLLGSRRGETVWIKFQRFRVYLELFFLSSRVQSCQADNTFGSRWASENAYARKAEDVHLSVSPRCENKDTCSLQFRGMITSLIAFPRIQDKQVVGEVATFQGVWSTSRSLAEFPK